MNDVTRRGFLGMAGMTTTAFGLAACAGTGGSTQPAGQGGAQSGGAANQIEFWSTHPGSSKDTELEIIKKFEAANPGVTVKLTDAGKNYEEVAQKLSAALAGNNLPDDVVVSDVT